MPVLHPKFLQCFCIYTHPCNLGTHTCGLTPFHPPLDTTTLAIVIDGVPTYPSSKWPTTFAGTRSPVNRV